MYTHYVYDTAGNLTHEYSGMSTPWTSTMPSSAYKLTTYTYDSRGRLTRLTDGLGQSESYTYDNNNNLITKTLRDGKQERYTYNALGKIVTDNVYASATATAPLSTRTYTYYPTGALKSVTEDGTTLSYTYDNHGNVLTESDGTSTKTYTYTPYDARSSYTLTMNGVLMESETYVYDAASRLIQVYTDYATVTHTYDTNGNRTQDLTVLANGTPISQQSYTYDAANRVVSVVGYVASGASVVIPVNESYTYYRDGSMYTKTSGGVTTTYTYDGAGRLTSETQGESVISYTYDASNNRTSRVANGVPTTYTYDANNRLLTENKNGRVWNYTYDINGNQLTGSGCTYSYDARGRQSVWTDGLDTVTYTYYPNDLWKSRISGAVTTNYVWDGQNMVYEYNGTNPTGGTAYYYGLTLISQGNYAYYLYNAHGDVVQLISSTGSLGWNYEYDAFGNELTLRESDSNPFRYAGQYYDKETGTYYLRARYYDPGIGRFTQQDSWVFSDPNQPLSLNLYTYCYGNPVNYIDPTGYWAESDSQFSSTVQIMLLQLTVAWYMAPTDEQKKDISKRADEIRQIFSSGIGGFFDKAKSVTGAMADEFSWFLGGDVDAAERDYWLTEAQKYQSDIQIDEKIVLNSIVFLAGIISPSPDDAWRMISKKASKEMLETVGEKGAKKFIKSIGKYAGSQGANGIKKLHGAGIKGFMYEVKVKGAGGAYRLLGNKTASGEILWEVFEKTH